MSRSARNQKAPDNRITHIIGCGVAGLACAVDLASSRRRVVIHESAGHAGGRCRSYYDTRLDRRIDNGNHLVLSGNRNLFSFLDRIGGRQEVDNASQAFYPFMDLRDGTHWVIHPNRGPVPWWIMSARRRVPDSRFTDYLSLLKLSRAGPGTVIEDIFSPKTPLYEKLWEPLAVGVLNTPASEAAACLLWPVIRQTFGRGAQACRACHFPNGLGAALIDPALRFLGAANVNIRFNHRLRGLTCNGNHVTSLHFSQGETIPLHPGDHLVLATPALVTKNLYPALKAPPGNQVIVNIHFRLPGPLDKPFPGGAKLLGLIGGISQWLFIRDDVVSVTISAANSLSHQPARMIAALSWPEVAQALGLGKKTRQPQLYRVVKEKQATFSQTPQSLRQRPPTATPLSNLSVAGDWTDTGLPATLEGAVLSGFKAAGRVRFLANQE